jgi:hypothetical protein
MNKKNININNNLEKKKYKNLIFKNNYKKYIL